MVYLIIYIIGFIAVSIHFINDKRKTDDITLSDCFLVLFLSIFSWLTFIVELVNWLKDNSGKIIVFKKKKIVMKTELVRVPFEVELAKKIQNGEVEGKIVTRYGRSVRVVCWDKKSDCWNNIVALIDMDFYEKVIIYRVTGIDMDTNEKENDLMLEIPEYMTFKDGDVIAFNGCNLIGVFKCLQYVDCAFCSFYFSLDKDLNLNSCQSTLSNGRLATEEEKQKLINALKESIEPKAKEYLKKFFGIEEKPKFNFKPFDKVLVRENDNDFWRADLFSNMEDDIYCCVGGFWEQCIPYRGNEHLLGTNNNPE